MQGWKPDRGGVLLANLLKKWRTDGQSIGYPQHNRKPKSSCVKSANIFLDDNHAVFKNPWWISWISSARSTIQWTVISFSKAPALRAGTNYRVIQLLCFQLQSFANVYVARRRGRRKRDTGQIISELISSRSVSKLRKAILKLELDSGHDMMAQNDL